LFDLDIRRAETLFKHVLEIDERVTLHDSSEDTWTLHDPDQQSYHLTKGVGGEVVRIIRPLSKCIQELKSQFN
jgi:5-oxoprolinase (ATP-hydrolysing)